MRRVTFEFAFDDERFSDKVLEICLSPPTSISNEQKTSFFPQVTGLDMDDDSPADHKQSKAPERVVVKRIKVSSVLLASDSRYFKAMLSNPWQESASKEIVIMVADTREAACMEAVLRFLYTNELQLSSGKAPSCNDLLTMLLLSDRFQIDSAVAMCSTLLAKELSVDSCARYLSLPESITLSDSCAELVTKARSFLAQHYKDFEASWLKDDDAFLQLNGNAVCAVLGSDALEVRSENTIYQAAKRWWRRSPLSPASSTTHSPSSQSVEAKQRSTIAQRQASEALGLALLRCVRLSFVSTDFLLDVAKREHAFCLPGACHLPKPRLEVVSSAAATAKPRTSAPTSMQPTSASTASCSPTSASRRIAAATSPFSSSTVMIPVRAELKCDPASCSCCRLRVLMDDLVAEAVEFQACSAKRKQIHPTTSRILMTKRAGSSKPSTITYHWQVSDVSAMPEGRYQFSPSFFVDGYYFRLQAGKIKWERQDGCAFALFLSLDLPATGLSVDNGFFVQTESQFLVKNTQSGQFEPTHLPSFDTFTAGVCELGYFDVFRRSWHELTAAGSNFVLNDTLHIGVTVKLL